MNYALVRTLLFLLISPSPVLGLHQQATSFAKKPLRAIFMTGRILWQRMSTPYNSFFPFQVFIISRAKNVPLHGRMTPYAFTEELEKIRRKAETTSEKMSHTHRLKRILCNLNAVTIVSGRKRKECHFELSVYV